VDGCILSHLHYQHVFQSPGALASAKSQLALYKSLRHETNSKPIHILSLNILTQTGTETSAKAGPEIWRRLTTSLMIEIYSMLSRTRPQLDRLSKAISQDMDLDLSPVSQNDDIERFAKHWKDVCMAQTILNKYYARQVRDISKLIEKHPAIFKERFSGQESRPKFKEHMCAKLNVIEKKIMHKSILRSQDTCTSRHSGSYLFRFRDVMPVVPYNCFLRMFLKTLETRPIADVGRYRIEVTTAQ
jgi:hypothetical protein